MTFGFKVMTESNSGKRPSWIWQIWWPKWTPASAPSKNEFSMFWSTSLPNFMLVDKSAKYPPNKSLRAWTNCTFFDLEVNKIAQAFFKLKGARVIRGYFAIMLKFGAIKIFNGIYLKMSSNLIVRLANIGNRIIK